jgi:hypothetical protein
MKWAILGIGELAYFRARRALWRAFLPNELVWVRFWVSWVLGVVGQFEELLAVCQNRQMDQLSEMDVGLPIGAG